MHHHSANDCGMMVIFNGSAMSKAFTKETDHQDDAEISPAPSHPIINYVTPIGFADLQNELRQIVSKDRPKVVETVRWAAGNGDRSENGDYIYGKRQLREMDRRIRYLTKQIESAKVVDPVQQKNLTKVFFGATVTYVEEDGTQKTVKIVGLDEADIEKNKISWVSPMAKALLKAELDDEVTLQTPLGVKRLTIVEIKY